MNLKDVYIGIEEYFSPQIIVEVTNMGFAAWLAGRWSNTHFIAAVRHLGWAQLVGFLFVTCSFVSFMSSAFLLN